MDHHQSSASSSNTRLLSVRSQLCFACAILVLAYLLGIGIRLASILLLFAAMFYNLGERQAGTVSSYSVFNEDGRALPGSLSATDMDGMVTMSSNESAGRFDRSTAALAQDAIKRVHNIDVGEMRNRDANKPCPCGSARKWKKCCGKYDPHQKEKQNQWEEEWT